MILDNFNELDIVETVASEGGPARPEAPDPTYFQLPDRKIIGDGDPSCTRCEGSGVVPVSRLTVATCECVREVERRQELDRISPGLAELTAAPTSILTGKVRQDLRVRADRAVLLAHLARALQDEDPLPTVRIASDLDLASAWLANVSRIRDEEVAERLASRDDLDRFGRLVDLVAPPALLILRVGVKAARMEGLAELVLEAVQTRQARGRPTWIVDTDPKPLAPGHLAHSAELAELTAEWPALRIRSAQERGEETDQAAEPAVPPQAVPPAPQVPVPRAPNPLVAAELAAGTWTPDRIDDLGNAWGRCPRCDAADRYSVFEMTRLKPGVAPRALRKCHSCGFPKVPGGKQEGAARPSARQVLIDKLRIGSPEAPEVARQELETLAPLRSLEAAKKQLQQEGYDIATRKGEGGRSYWRKVS